jgi:Rieske 2Fe-2S family protein
MEPALPREMYVDQQTWLAEREAALFGQWFCVGRADDLGLRTPAAWSPSMSRASRCW